MKKAECRIQNENRVQPWAGLRNPLRISGYCRRDNFCRPIEGGCPLPPGNGDGNPPHPSPRVWSLGMLGAHTGVVAICFAPGLGHPVIRDPQRSEDSRKGVTHCKHGGSGVGDKVCTPIQDELSMLGLERELPRTNLRLRLLE